MKMASAWNRRRYLAFASQTLFGSGAICFVGNTEACLQMRDTTETPKKVYLSTSINNSICSQIVVTKGIAILPCHISN